jgi:hypothetical protein
MLVTAGAIQPEILQIYLYEEVKSGKNDGDGGSSVQSER